MADFDELILSQGCQCEIYKISLITFSTEYFQFVVTRFYCGKPLLTFGMKTQWFQQVIIKENVDNLQIAQKLFSSTTSLHFILPVE